jgi:hypothetical protein
MADPSSEIVLAAPRLIPRSQGDSAETPLPSVTAAVAASWALGIPGDVIRDALLM